MDNGPRTKCDQVVFEAVCKACEIIVASRSHLRTTEPSQQRFNLQVPEIYAVREILSRWKTTGLPFIRVDVYYQHDNTNEQRELLERWCLSYLPQTMATFLSREPQVPNDPIVQLRQVCKRIVIFLRTLYCQARLIGAHKLKGDPKVGFSVYAVGSENEQELVQQQNFLQTPNVDSVITPYGELRWKVLHSRSINRLVVAPQKLPQSRPIPIQQQRQAHTDEPQRQTTFVAQSAPSHLAFKGPSSAPRRSTPMPIPATTMTYQSSGIPISQSVDRRNTYQRSHTADELPPHEALFLKAREMTNKDEDTKAPTRVLSGLSLALLSVEDDNANSEAKQQRRTALHRLPPQLDPTPPSKPGQHQGAPVVPSAEYGYGYNSHIAWQAIQPSQSNPTTARRRESFEATSASPHHTPNTPPGAAFLGVTPPTILATASLIPPKQQAVTPPFVRPVGFSQDPASSTASPKPTVANLVPEQLEKTLPAEPVELPPPSLDLLQSNPFGQQSLVGGSQMLPPETAFSMSSTITPSDVPGRKSPIEEMPFAVDDLVPPATSSSSAGVASFAQHCQSTQRLKLFESTVAEALDVDQQLHEFTSFGASLLLGGSDDHSSKSTPQAVSAE